MAIYIYLTLGFSAICVIGVLINNWWCKRSSSKMTSELLLEFNRYGPEYSSQECPLCHARAKYPCHYIKPDGEVLKEIEMMRIHSERVGIVSYEKRALTLPH